MNFDLNINNYNKQELEEILGLPPNYDISIVEIKETQMRENINSDRSINENIRFQTLQFLEQAKSSLIKDFKNIIMNKVSSLNIYNTDTRLKSSAVTQEGGSHYIIDKPSTPFSQSFPGEFYPGVINPLKKRYLRQNLNIDTKFRDNYYNTQSSNFHFDLPMKFSNAMSLQLSAFEFCSSYYIISKQYGNNFFSITIDAESAVITIPDGNYSNKAFVDYLNDYVTSGPLVGTIFSYIIFTINLDNVTNSGSGQMIIGTKVDGITFTLDFQSNLNGQRDFSTPLPLKLGWIMGFRLGSYTDNNTYVSEGIVNLRGANYFYLAIDDYNNNVNNSFYSAFNSSILNKNILARISFDNRGGFINYSENNLSLITSPRQYFGPVDIQKLNIQLLDEYGRIMDLNNMDYSFCLTFKTMYDL
jgi:hypothetical protein